MKKAILMIHGLFGDAQDNIYLENFLKNEHYTVRSFNLPDHENIAPIRNVTRNDWIDAVRSKVQELVCDRYEEIILIGHSLGGIIATVAAVDPELKKYISAVILIAPAINYWGSRYRKRWYMKRFCRSFLFLFSRKKPSLAHLKKVRLKAIVEFLKISQENKDTAKEVKQPLLVIHGTADSVIPIEYSRELWSRIPNENKKLIEIDGGNHWPFLFDKKEEAASLITEYIKALEKERGLTGLFGARLDDESKKPG